LNPSTIIDIGANTGQFAALARSLYQDAFIYSFEPLEECLVSLQSSMKGDNKFQAFNFALGDKSGNLQMHQNDFSPLSSIHVMGNLHKTVMPVTEYTKKSRFMLGQLIK
jgi:FkbM family methyltransferase